MAYIESGPLTFLQLRQSSFADLCFTTYLLKNGTTATLILLFATGVGAPLHHIYVPASEVAVTGDCETINLDLLYPYNLLT